MFFLKSLFSRASRISRALSSVSVYLAVIVASLTAVSWRMQAQENQPAAQASPAAAASPQASPVAKPFFSLQTNRSYGPHENARIYINYQVVNTLDFRVYQVRDPFKFFEQLTNPHQMGEEDRGEIAEVAEKTERKPSLLEKLRVWKSTFYYTFKSYFRSQLRRESRATFNDKFRAGEQIKLTEADYARVPLLNPDQLRRSWRQVLTPLDNRWDTRMISLGKLDPGVYLVEAVNGDLRAYTIALVTDLTMLSKVTEDGEMLVYSVDRRSGEPRDDVDIKIVRGQKVVAEGKTDKQGLLRTRVSKTADPKPAENENEGAGEVEPDQDVGPDGYLIMARRKDDFAVSDLDSYLFAWNRGGDEGGQLGNVTGYIYSERPVYRPDQKVYFKGILRRLGEGGYEMLDARSVSVAVTDGEGNEILRKDLPLSGRGTFNGEVDLAAGAPLGGYSIVVSIDGAEAARGYFQVAEYKKPEYKVRVSTPKTFVMTGDKTTFNVEAKYFFGAPVKNADVKYYVYRSRYYPWWWESEDDGIGESEGEEEDEGGYGYGNDLVKEGEGRLDENGRLEIPFDVPQPGASDSSDFTYRLEAMVTDSARREIEGKASFVGIRSNTVINASTDRYVYFQGDTAKLKIETKDREGRPLSSKVTLKFVEVKYEKVEEEKDGYKNVRFKPIYNTLSSADVSTTAAGETFYEYRVPIVGYIDVQVFVNENGKQIEYSGTSLYATDRNNGWADSAYRDYGSIKLVFDKKSYQPGETAKVLALLPTDKAHLLVTVELTKVLDAKHVFANGRAAMIEIPILPTYSPNVYLSVAYIRDGEMYEQGKSINVPAKNKFLNVEIMPDKKEYRPRDPASYTLMAKNADGTPASGVELSLGVVDEAIYSVQPETTGDIRRAFYGTRYSTVNTRFSSFFTFTGYSGAKKMQLAQVKRAYQLADFKNESQLVEPKIRKEFKDTAFWQPAVITGADGKATVKLNLPDNLTTWRATARAVTDDLKVGSSVARVISRKDLILRLETPRFMTEGDTVTISGVVHNYLNADKSTKIKLEVNGPGAKLLDQAEQTVTILKQGEARIDWKVSATQVGAVSLTAYARTDTESDAVELPVPIIAGGLKQTRGNSVALAEESGEKTLSFDLPANAHQLARSLRIEASPSVAGALFGALDYLTSYPYGCVEQTMSSFLPNVVVAKTLQDVKTTSLKATDLDAKVQRGLDRLYNFQHEDGGWGWWKDDRTDPFMTAYVMDGLTMARRAGYGIDNYRLDRGRTKLKALLDAGKLEDGKPYDLEARAYLLYALQASGETDARYVNDLYGRRTELQPYGRALLALTLKLRNDDRARLVASDIERSAKLTDYDAHWESKRRPMLDFSEENDLEATALSLKALAQISKDSQVLPRAARWLVANRRNGYYWQTTKHTAFAIYGLTDYLRVSRELAADYTLEVYLNGEQVMLKRVTAAEAATGQAVVIKRDAGAVGNANQIRVVKRGSGVAYVAATLDYYTREETTAAQSPMNLKLTREYLRLRVTDNGGQLKWTTEPLTGELRSGDMLVVRLHVQGNKAQYLLVEDPIPAGCEQVERFSGLNLDASLTGWCDWFSQREFRDQRTALFLDYFDGDTTFQYALRVQIPGEFKIAPARAELMYQPSVQANTASMKLNIFDKQ